MIEKSTIIDEIPIQVKQNDTPKQLSSQVFSGYLKWSGISMFVASLISVVMLVMVNATYTKTQSLDQYSTLSKYFLKTTLLALYQTIQQCDNITPGYWCTYPIQSIQYFTFFPSKGKFSNSAQVNKLIANHTNQKQICYHFNTFKITIGDIEYNAHQIRTFCYVLDGLIVFIILVLLIVNQYRSEQRHSGKKKYMIDKFSVRISNLPCMPKYQLLVRLKQFIEKQVEEYLISNPISRYKFQIFDMSANGQLQQSNSVITKKPEENDHPTQNILKQINQQNTNKKQYNTTQVWVTFQTTSNRKLVLNIFKMNGYYMRLLYCFISKKVKTFQGYPIEIEKAPNPEDIIYENIDVTLTNRIAVRLVIYFVCLVLLVGTTFLLLFLKRLSSIILSSVAVLLTNLLAPIILIFLSKYQRHALITNQNISNINKIAIYKFINTGLVVFLSQFKIQGLFNYFSSYFTNEQFSSVTNSDWILNTGLSIVYTMMLSIIVSNFRLLSIYVVYYVKVLKNKLEKKSEEEEIPHVSMGKIDGYQLYAQIAAVMMIILSYSYLLPILYPIGFLILFTNYCTFLYVKKYSVFPCDSFNSLTKTASSLTLLAITLHMGVIAIIQSSKIHFSIACVLVVFYICRVFLLKLVIAIINTYKRSSNIKKQTKIRQKSLFQEQQFVKLLSFQKRYALRQVLKIRRDLIVGYDTLNPDLKNDYSKRFWQFLIYQRDVLKFSSKMQGCIIGQASYYH